MKIAILGCGAMGSIYAVRLAEAGHDVWAIDPWQAHIDAIRDQGLRVTGPDGPIHSTRVTALTDLDQAPPCALYVIATKADGVAAAAQSIAPHMPAEAAVLTIQNGLGAGDRLAAHLPRDRILLGVAEGFGAAMDGPGAARHTSMKQIRMGEIDGGPSDRLTQIAEAWRAGGFQATPFDDITQLIWEKFLCNVTLSGPCTAFDCTVAELRAAPDRWAVALGCMTEAWTAGQALSVPFSFDDPVAYVTAFAERVGNASPSMRQDHHARRRSELDAINGQVPVIAARFGQATPYNDTICAILRAREATFDGATP